MGKIKAPEDRIKQISVGFTQRQLTWLDENKGVNLNLLCRNAVDEQIELSKIEEQNE